MEGAKRILLGSRKKPKRRKNRRFVRNLIAYLNSDDYLFAPLFANSESSKANDISMAGIETLEMKKVKRKMSEKVKEYLNSDCHMYGLSPETHHSPPEKKMGKRDQRRVAIERRS